MSPPPDVPDAPAGPRWLRWPVLGLATVGAVLSVVGMFLPFARDASGTTWSIAAGYPREDDRVAVASLVSVIAVVIVTTLTAVLVARGSIRAAAALATIGVITVFTVGADVVASTSTVFAEPRIGSWCYTAGRGAVGAAGLLAIPLARRRPAVVPPRVDPR